MDCQARGTKVRFIHHRETLYRYPSKHIFCLIAIHQHLAFLLHTVLARFLLSFSHVA